MIKKKKNNLIPTNKFELRAWTERDKAFNYLLNLPNESLDILTHSIREVFTLQLHYTTKIEDVWRLVKVLHSKNCQVLIDIRHGLIHISKENGAYFQLNSPDFIDIPRLLTVAFIFEMTYNC